MNIIPNIKQDGVLFSCQDVLSLAVSEWARHDLTRMNGRPFGIGTLDLFIAEDRAEIRPDGIFIPHAHLAYLAAWQLAQLGLPSPLPYQLRIHPKRLINSPDFNISYIFIGSDGLPVDSVKRTGLICQVAEKQYSLLNPIFQILELLDNFNSAETDLDSRLLFWAKVRTLLPAADMVEGPLGSYNIVQANTFTIDIQRTSTDLVLNPYLLGIPIKDDFANESIQSNALLPLAAEEQFLKYFHKNQVRQHYALPGNHYVVLAPELKQTLEIVKQVQRGSLSEKQTFINNPIAYIKNQLDDVWDDEILESIFVETPLFLSSRIKGFGIWEPKGNFFWNSSGQNWLDSGEKTDADGITFYIGERIVSLSLAQIPAAAQAMAEALENKDKSITVANDIIPADPETLNILNAAASILQAGSETSNKQPAPKDFKPLIDDNIEQVENTPVHEEAVRVNVWDGELPLADAFKLHAHQLDGLKWLKGHWQSSSPAGCLLADDMGLGKTLQTLCFMMWLKKQMEYKYFPKRPMLIIAPTGLLDNWANEAERFFPMQGLGSILKAYGQSFAKLARNNERQAKNDLAQADWALTTYETLRDKINTFVAVDFALVVFDEAQKIKNPGSMVTDMAKALKSEMTLALSGTPVENSMRDIWCIIDAVKPGFLGSCREFMEKYSDRGSNEQSLLLELKEQLSGGQHAVLLRRLKEEQWLERPQKTEKVYCDPMSQLQAAAYTTVIEKAKVELKNNVRGAMLTAIQGLRQVSLHCPLQPDTDIYSLPEQSARIARTLTILDELAGKSEKCLIFIEFIETQAAMAEIIAHRYNCGPVPVINGTMPGSNRLKAVQQFQNNHVGEFAVMLIAPKAGGVGLNLTAATHVIHLSRWWNPAVEDQCSDRAYRIGQKSDVTIHYPLAIHPQFEDKSFDVNLHKLLSRKRELSQSLLTPVGMTESDRENLFNESIF